MTPVDAHWSTIGAFWASISAAVVALSATVINYLFFRSQVDPNVIVYASPDEKRPSMIVLIIKNIGKSLALDVNFKFSRPLPKKAYGLNHLEAKEAEIMDEGPLINGIPALGPDSKRIINWGQYGGLYKYIGDDSVTVTVTFKSDRMRPLPQKMHVVQCPIDIKSFEQTDASDSNWDKKSANELKRIADTLINWQENKPNFLA